MAASVPHLRVSSPADEVEAALREHGAVIVDELIDASTIERINNEIAPFLAEDQLDREFLNPAIAFFFGKHTRHVTGVCAKSPSFVTDVMCHPTYLALCDAILRPSCARYHLNLGHIMDRGPGAERQMLHRDEAVWPHMPKPHPELQLASIVALVDFTRENGATALVPGSHRWAAERQAEEHEVAYAEMSAGSAVIYLGSTIHAGGGNTTADQWRRGVHLSYVLGWLRTEENNYLGTPVDVVRGYPRIAQELIGYAAHDAIADGGGYLGMVDLRDPVDLIEEGKL